MLAQNIDFGSRPTIVGVFPCDINVLTARTALFSSAVHFLLSRPLMKILRFYDIINRPKVIADCLILVTI